MKIAVWIIAIIAAVFSFASGLTMLIFWAAEHLQGTFWGGLAITLLAITYLKQTSHE